MKLTAIVNNLPTNLFMFAWITARAVDGELWYYGACNNKEYAQKQAREIDGIVLKVED